MQTLLDLNLTTPVEEYTIGGKKVLVKRDDLVGDNDRYPYWGKQYAVEACVAALDKTTPLVHLTVGQSYSGWALAAAAKAHGVKLYLTIPNSKKVLENRWTQKAVDYGAELIPLHPNMTSILRKQTQKIARENGWQIMPYGFAMEEFFQGIKDRIDTVDRNSYNSIVVSVGTGGCACGVLLAARGEKQVYAISVSPLSGPEQIIRTRFDGELPSNLELVRSPFKFEEPVVDVAPFPCNKSWDAKAWVWMNEHIADLADPILFYNIGA